MATRTTRLVETNLDKAWVYEYTPLTTGDPNGDPLEAPGKADRSVQVRGAFGTGTFVLQGSNVVNPSVAADWATLNDHFGTPISVTAVGIYGIAEITRHIRPIVTGADGATDLDVDILLRRQP
jgi:hypothetical protein